jgi:uncharacterized protein YndB with AHSA1/START domain
MTDVGGSASTTINASPEAVYDLVAAIERMPEWSPETYKAHWVGGATDAKAGARFRGWNKAGPLRWFTDPVIDVAERGRELTFTTTFLGKGRLTTWSFTMRPADGGGTELTESWSENSDLMARALPKRRVEGLRQGMEQTLARIKAAAEA